MRALVTGGAGFIGSHLVDRLLAEGWSVEVVDDLSSGSLANLSEARARRGELRIDQLDIRSPVVTELIERRRPEVVFHLAAQPSVAASVDDPAHDADVNVVGSVRVLEGAARAGVGKVVYAASGGSLYGDTRRVVDESDPHRPVSPYGVAKKTVIDYLQLFRERRGLEFTALALANVFGPRQDPHGEAGVVAGFAADLASERPSRIDGDGNQTRDFVYVEDVVDAFVRAASRGGGLLLNVSTGKGTSIKRLYRMMAQLAGAAPDAVHGPARPGDVRHSVLSPAKAQLHLGWKPFTRLDDGLSLTLAAAARRVAAGTVGR